MVIERSEVGHVVKRGEAQRVRLAGILRQVRNGSYIHIPLPAEIKHIFVAELAVEVGNAGDRLHQIVVGGAARMNHLEHGAHQPAVAIFGQRGDHLRAADAKTNARVAPRMAPIAGAGHHRTFWLADIFHNRKVAGVHEGKAGRHHDADDVGFAWIERRIGVGAMHGGETVGDLRHILRCRPAADQAVTEIAGVGWVGE